MTKVSLHLIESLDFRTNATVPDLDAFLNDCFEEHGYFLNESAVGHSVHVDHLEKIIAMVESRPEYRDIVWAMKNDYHRAKMLGSEYVRYYFVWR